MIRALPLILFAVGCGNVYPHVKLDEAPAASAPYEARAAYYKKHSADSFAGGSMVLHDGTAVYWPEDLKPAVDPESPTAKAIDRVADAKKKLEPMENVTAGSALVAAGGLASMGASLVPLMLNNGGDNELLDTATFGLLIGGSVALTGGALVASFTPMFFMAEQQEHNDAIRAVVTTYQQSLTDRVAIQADANGMLVDLNVSDKAPEPPATASSQSL